MSAAGGWIYVFRRELPRLSRTAGKKFRILVHLAQCVLRWKQPLLSFDRGLHQDAIRVQTGRLINCIARMYLIIMICA